MTGLMAGKRGIIMGVANNRSIAWGIAKSIHAHGGEVALTYQGEALKKRVEPRQVRESIPLLRELQHELKRLEIPLDWPWERGEGLA